MAHVYVVVNVVIFKFSESFNASKQLDGAVDTSDEDESEESDDNMDNDDDDDLDKDDDEDAENDGGAEEEPLNSDDDVTDEDASDVFETDNVIVCQYDKVSCWSYYLSAFILAIMDILCVFSFGFTDHTFTQQMEVLP